MKRGRKKQVVGRCNGSGMVYTATTVAEPHEVYQLQSPDGRVLGTLAVRSDAVAAVSQLAEAGYTVRVVRVPIEQARSASEPAPRPQVAEDADAELRRAAARKMPHLLGRHDDNAPLYSVVEICRRSPAPAPLYGVAASGTKGCGTASTQKRQKPTRKTTPAPHREAVSLSATIEIKIPRRRRLFRSTSAAACERYLCIMREKYGKL